MEERKRLTKEIKDVEKATIEEIMVNSCYYDKNNNNDLVFHHLMHYENVYQLMLDLFEVYDSSMQFSEDISFKFLRTILIENSQDDLFKISGLLCNFFCLIEANAKLRERLKEYEDAEFGEE